MPKPPDNKWTLSGWPAVPAGTPNVLNTFTIPGTITPKTPRGRRLTVRKDVGPYLVSFAAEFNKRVMKLNEYTGAYNYRQARNSSKLSDHSGGVAVDINWNVLNQGNRKSLTKEQHAEIVKMLDEYPGMGWGGYYGGGINGRSPMYDPMHFFLDNNNAEYYLNQMKKKGIDSKGRIKK
jgi:hypothetical protein